MAISKETIRRKRDYVDTLEPFQKKAIYEYLKASDESKIKKTIAPYISGFGEAYIRHLVAYSKEPTFDENLTSIEYLGLQICHDNRYGVYDYREGVGTWAPVTERRLPREQLPPANYDLDAGDLSEYFGPQWTESVFYAVLNTILTLDENSDLEELRDLFFECNNHLNRIRDKYEYSPSVITKHYIENSISQIENVVTCIKRDIAKSKRELSKSKRK